jgi:hypothetical protein
MSPRRRDHEENRGESHRRTLGVVEGEEVEPIRTAADVDGDANFAIVRRMALSLLKNETSQKGGVKAKRHTAGWNEDYLEQVLCGS